MPRTCCGLSWSCTALELKVSELERRLRSDSTTSGTPPPKDPIGAKDEHSHAERAVLRARGLHPASTGKRGSRASYSAVMINPANTAQATRGLGIDAYLSPRC